MQEPQTINSEKAMSEIEVIVANIRENYDKMLLSLNATLEKFNNFCRDTDVKLENLDVRINAHDRLHQELKEQQKEFEERIAKRSAKQLTIVAIVISVISLLSGIIIKLS